MKKIFEKIKNILIKLKENWKNPRKRAAIKLGFYFIFFVILFCLANISNALKNIDNTVNNKNNNNVVDKEKQDNKRYSEKQNKLLNSKHNINYIIKINDIEYKINGMLNNNIIDGYLESNDGIKKINIENDTIYEIINNEKNILNSVIDTKYININYIISTIKLENSVILNKDENKNYKYDIYKDGNNLLINVFTNSENIYKIEINVGNEEYQLNFDI